MKPKNSDTQANTYDTHTPSILPCTYINTSAHKIKYQLLVLVAAAIPLPVGTLKAEIPVLLCPHAQTHRQTHITHTQTECI